jgi:hypothetical protein
METLPDLDLRLEACDSTCLEATKTLFESFSLPIGGIMLLAMVLQDQNFIESHTALSYAEAFLPKRDTFVNLESCYPIETLDFLVALSSATIFGSASQTNYAR